MENSLGNDVEEKRSRRADKEKKKGTTEKQIEHIEISVAKEEKKQLKEKHIATENMYE